MPLWKTLQTLISVTKQKSDDQTHGFTIAVTHKPQGKKHFTCFMFAHSTVFQQRLFTCTSSNIYLENNENISCHQVNNRSYSPSLFISAKKKLKCKLIHCSHLDFSKCLTYIPAGIVPSCCATLCSYHLHQWRNAVLHLFCTNEILKIDIVQQTKLSRRNVICQMVFISNHNQVFEILTTRTKCQTSFRVGDLIMLLTGFTNGERKM